MVFCFLFVRPWEKDALSKDLWTDLTILMWYEHTPKSNDRWKVILTEYKQILLWYSIAPEPCIFLLHFYSKYQTWCLLRLIFENSAKLVFITTRQSVEIQFHLLSNILKWNDYSLGTLKSWLSQFQLSFQVHTYHCQKFVFANFCALSLNVVEINWWARNPFLQLLFS